MELHDHSSTWQGEASAEKERILARQHGSALKSHSGDTHKLYLSPAAPIGTKNSPIHHMSQQRLKLYDRSLELAETRGAGGPEAGDNLHATHPAVLVPAVRAVAARITAEHAVAGPLRQQYQVLTCRWHDSLKYYAGFISCCCVA